jgi:hypothetical protein
VEWNSSFACAYLTTAGMTGVYTAVCSRGCQELKGSLVRESKIASNSVVPEAYRKVLHCAHTDAACLSEYPTASDIAVALPTVSVLSDDESLVHTHAAPLWCVLFACSSANGHGTESVG